MAEDVVKSCIKALGVYLLSEVVELQQYINGFPEANKDMNFPSISMSEIGDPLYIKEKNPTALSLGTVVDNKAVTIYDIGTWEIELQLDLWAKYKEQRNDIAVKVFIALTKDGPANPLILTLTDYFNQNCLYTSTTMTNESDEFASQVKEWRKRFRILVDVSAIQSQEEFVIIDTEIQDDIGFNVIT